MKTIARTTTTGLTFCVLGFLVTGCGNILESPGMNRVPYGAGYNGAYGVSLGANSATDATANNSVIVSDTTTQNQESSYSCSYFANITLGGKNSYGTNSSDFTMCPSKTAPSSNNVFVKGKSTTNVSICIFPASADWYGRKSYFTSASVGGVPYYKCVNLPSQGTAVSFSELSSSQIFNAAYIVDGNSATSMQNCLYTNNLSYCPAYSTGTFR